MFSVYVHTNRQNGKRYVGITANDPAARWNHGRGYKSNKRFWPDIEALGWDAFDHEIVASGLTKQEAVEKEAELIREYDTVANGYNNEHGGRYATQGFLRGDARLFYDGLVRITDRRSGFDRLNLWRDVLRDADENGGYLASNLNDHFIPEALRRVSDWWPYKPWNDPIFAAYVVWELDYFTEVLDAIARGETPPPYVRRSEFVDAVLRKKPPARGQDGQGGRGMRTAPLPNNNTKKGNCKWMN